MRRVAGIWLVALAGALAVSAQAPASRLATDVRRALLSTPGIGGLYQPIGFSPIWLDENGTPTLAAHDAVRVLGAAADEGLNPADYDATSLRGRLGSIENASIDDRVSFEVALSAAMLRYLEDVHRGRVDPRAIGFTLNVPRDGHDFEALLRGAAATRRVIETARAWTPRGPQYPALAAALRRYRDLERTDEPFELTATRSVHPGERYSSLTPLWKRLVFLGDADSLTPPPPGDVYAGAIVDAVRRFQHRHGLDADGVLGRRTLAQLRVPVASRVTQIELAMERLRWLPHEADTRLVLVNIAMFRLFAWDTIPPAGVPDFTTGTIVGRAMGTRTPVFAATLNEIIFRPAWNVPTSITRKEILPKLARDPGYLARERMELVAGQGDHAPVVEATPENLAQLRDGRVRLRQRPGANNALGLIKFSFPNEHDVYMHDTPAQSLFARSRRDFSHGCVRVQDPVGLAVWVLGNRPDWSRERIEAAMHAASPSRVPVQPPVSVLMIYSTAAVQLDSGDVTFAEDIYGHDPRLSSALAERRTAGME